MTNDRLKTKIENMVSSITLNQNIDIEHLAANATDIKNPKRFPGIVFRMKDPDIAMLIFRTGKVICSGARSREHIEIAVDRLIAKLKEGGIEVTERPEIVVQNIVASARLGFKVNLDVLAMGCENTEYEPEQFPGLVYRLPEPKTVMLIFRSGKIIITGAKTPENARTAARKTESLVKEYDAIIN